MTTYRAGLTQLPQPTAEGTHPGSHQHTVRMQRCPQRTSPPLPAIRCCMGWAQLSTSTQKSRYQHHYQPIATAGRAPCSPEGPLWDPRSTTNPPAAPLVNMFNWWQWGVLRREGNNMCVCISGLQTPAGYLPCPHLHSATDVPIGSDLCRHWGQHTAHTAHPQHLCPAGRNAEDCFSALQQSFSPFGFVFLCLLAANLPLLFHSKHFSLYWFNFCSPICCDRR